MKLLVAFAAAALLSAPGLAKPACRDAKGHFARCPTSATSAGMGIKKDASGKCHWESGLRKGKFVKCPPA